MSPPNEEAPGRDQGLQNNRPADRPGQSTSRVRQTRPPQIDRVRAMLSRDWTCATQFLQERLPRYGARIYDLRQEGFYIDRRVCERHDWHETVQFQWRIVGHVDDGTLPGIGNV